MLMKLWFGEWKKTGFGKYLPLAIGISYEECLLMIYFSEEKVQMMLE